ncbi:MAG: tol-pal system protein YbgF [Arenimonas sp.]
MTCVLVVAAAFAVATPAFAQRQSLGDRVTALELKSAQQAQADSQSSVDQVNRLTQLQAEVQSLRGLVEQLTNEIEQLKQRGRDQYVDIDTRLQRLEGGAPSASTPPAAARPSAVTGPESTDTAGTTAPQPGMGNPADEAAAYGAAFDSLKAGDYVASARGFHDFLETYPSAALAPNAWYWLGESYYVTQNYPLAAQSFETLLNSFPESNKAPDALLKLGFAQLEMGNRGAGERTLRQVMDRYPGGDVGRLAESRLRALDLESR